MAKKQKKKINKQVNDVDLHESGNVPDRESLLEDEHQGNQDQDPVFPHSKNQNSFSLLDGLRTLTQLFPAFP
jgi:hypothetical protein